MMNKLASLTRFTLLAHLAATSRSVVRAFPLRSLGTTQQIFGVIAGSNSFRTQVGIPTTTTVTTTTTSRTSSSSTRRFSSSSSSMPPPSIRHIGKREMEEIVDDYEHGGREDSGYVIMDVRGEDEVQHTGKVSPKVITLPLPIIMTQNVFALDDDQFEAVCGFEKPAPDETLVFTCAAGIRSQHAAYSAAQAGYSNLVNYAGGANEWFQR